VTQAKVTIGAKKLREEGHTVEIQVRGEKTWFEVDGRMLVSWKEMASIAEGVTIQELEGIYKRRAEKEHEAGVR
jgi:hypothetical protein